MNSSLIQVEFKDLKVGQVVYYKGYPEMYGPFICCGFVVNRRTRKLPFGTRLVTSYYADNSCGFLWVFDVSNDCMTAVISHKQFYIDPTAKIMLDCVSATEESDVPF